MLHGANPDNPNQFGQTPLEGAVQILGDDAGTSTAQTDVAIIKLLLQNGANASRIKQDAGSFALLKSHGVLI